MIKYQLEFGIGKRKTFTINFLAKSHASAAKEFDEPKKIVKDIEMVMEREDISTDNGWHKYQSLNLTCLGGGHHKNDPLYDLIDGFTTKIFKKGEFSKNDFSEKDIDDLSEYFNMCLKQSLNIIGK
jgi:hypothetical protein